MVSRDKFRLILCCILLLLLVLLFGKHLGLHKRLSVIVTTLQPPKQYKPTWESVDTRPLPDWYDNAKFGIFLHWGLYSVPAFGSEWFWYNWETKKDPAIVDYMKKNYPQIKEYKDFIALFTAEKFNADYWAELFQASGARYVVLTSKHHEGWTLWGSKQSSIGNSVDSGPHRDLVGELAASIAKKTDLHFGLYYSLLEWYNPLYLSDKASNFEKNDYIKNVVTPQLNELIVSYKPDVLWLDGDWGGSDKYWNATNFLAWLYSESSVKDTIVTNDRWGERSKHGDYITKLQKINDRKWENAITIDKKSWGYRREANKDDFRKLEDVISSLVRTVSCGGNFLLNIGPSHEGLIHPVFDGHLREIGSWLKINGEAIYNTKPWKHQKDKTSSVWYTSRSKYSGITVVYAILLEWPTLESSQLQLGSVKKTDTTSIEMLGLEKDIQWQGNENGISITLPLQAELPCRYAWVFQLRKVVG
uniref:alpha-L-fucosidase n=1 Tax=Saccoglossus kowalevskii TaxID=10224 RepID=A0ABM0GPI1_SACKO|nr:PREDICTED: alpha-L-fucosidase-like [Saccoglossus kowalevskii]